MKKFITIAITIAALLCASTIKASASEPYFRGPAPYARVGIGGPTHFNVGLGFFLTKKLSLGVEAASLSSLTGFAGMFDARYYFLNREITPFIDIKSGYGLVGKNYECEDIYNMAHACMVGMSWRKVDVGLGVTYDAFSRAMPTANISFTFPFGR